MKDIWIEPVTLRGRKIRIEPLNEGHLDSLAQELLTPNAWHSVHFGIKSKQDLADLVDRSNKWREAGTGQSFAIVIEANGAAVGMSSFYNVNRHYFSIEIGFTWIGQHFQKTLVNTEAKFLMLQHAFETLNCQRVSFKVDALNFNSQRAVTRLGAKYEGELRQFLRLPDGRKRDFKLYSIVDSEWKNVKDTLIWYQERYV